MSGITELSELLASMKPILIESEFDFCTVTGELKEYVDLQPKATFIEAEGLTLILEKKVAEKAQLAFSGCFRQITLTVHSSLEAVGLTAAVSAKLAEHNISANVVAAYYHDHIFVHASKADAAMIALQSFNA